jgi:hypothetical protein
VVPAVKGFVIEHHKGPGASQSGGSAFADPPLPQRQGGVSITSRRHTAECFLNTNFNRWLQGIDLDTFG